MLTCHRCGMQTARLTVEQTRCPRCQREVTALIEQDSRRRSVVRFLVARDMRGVAA